MQARVPHSAPIIVTGPAVSERLSTRVVHDLALHIVRARSTKEFLLPTEPELCAQFQVSRTVLREAIRTLQARGLVSVVQGQGMLAQPRESWNHLDSDVLNWQCEAGVDEHFVISLYEVRQIFEPAAASLSALRATEAEIDRLQDCFDRMMTGVADPEAYVKADLEFHNIIVASCGNEILAQFTYSISAALRAGRELSMEVPSGWGERCELHKAVLDAIRGRDPQGAASSILVIIRKAFRDVQAILKARKDARESLNDDLSPTSMPSEIAETQTYQA